MDKYTINIVKGALMDPDALNKYNPKIIETFDDEWECLLEVELGLDQIKDVQKNMVKHHENSTPWYMDGYLVKNEDKILVAFGADDGSNGKIFTFDRFDKETYQKMFEYALSVGIPKEQIDFLE